MCIRDRDKVDLRYSEIKYDTLYNSNIKTLSAFIDDGFILLIYNPIDSTKKIVGGDIPFEMKNLKYNG